MAIVESEKTAVITSAYLPQFLWLAYGGLTGLTTESCSVLAGRTVVLFPDLNGFAKWSNRAKELSTLGRFIVSDLLERRATDDQRARGLDIADYLVRADFISKRAILPALPRPKVSGNPRISGAWTEQITALEQFFETVSIPAGEIRLNGWTKILDAKKFVSSHIATLKRYNCNRHFLPFLYDLQASKDCWKHS